MSVWVSFQGLGLLINLVEYSARNRYCLVEMEMEGGAPWESVLAPTQEELNTGSLSAIAALVQVGAVDLCYCVSVCMCVCSGLL